MILMNDFKAEPGALRDATREAIDRVLASGWYVLGREVEQFEADWAKRCDTRYGVGTASGLDAIEIGLRALDIGEGDEVITTPMTAFATTLAILRAGAVPVIADIDPGTALLDRGSVERCISDRTRAVILVHLYGQVRDVSGWASFCDARGLALIEDCAQSHLAAEAGKSAGSFGALGAYSFYPTKNLGALGDAGMLVTNTKEIADRSAKLRNYGQSVRYHHPEIGMNSRLDEMQAAILGVRLKWLEEFTGRRQQIAARYVSELSSPHVSLLAPPQTTESHVYHLFVAKCERRDALMAHLQEHEVQSLIHYPVPVHQQPPCHAVKRDPRGLPQAEHFASVCLSLPCHPQMTEDDVSRVVAAVNGFSG